MSSLKFLPDILKHALFVFPILCERVSKEYILVTATSKVNFNHNWHDISTGHIFDAVKSVKGANN